MKKRILIALLMCGVAYFLLYYFTGVDNEYKTLRYSNKVWHTRDSMIIEAHKKAGRIKIVKDSVNKAP